MHINTLKGPSKLHGFPGASVVKNLPVNVRNAEDVGLIPGLGRSTGVGNGIPVQHSCLENSIDRGVWQAAVHGVEKELDVTEQSI